MTGAGVLPKTRLERSTTLFARAGGNFIDTAKYLYKWNQRIVRRGVCQRDRQSMVIATKYTNAVPGNDPNAAGNHRKSMMALQIEYSLIERTVERELVPMSKALNLGLTAWSPLSNGVLTGKYHGHGSSDESGLLNSEMLKEFVPEQKRTRSEE